MTTKEFRDQLDNIADGIKQAECDLHALFSRLERVAKQLGAEPPADEIKPCPFPSCGSKNCLVDRAGLFWVKCPECLTSGPALGTRTEAIDAWNALPRNP